MAKNILYIADTGRIIGGGEISLLNLLENLDKDRFRAVVCVPGEGDWTGRVRELGIPVHFFTYKKVMDPFNVAHTIRAVRALCGIIMRENIDIVHTNSTGGVVVLAGIACSLMKRPLVSHIRLVYSGFLQDIVQGFLSTKIIIISRRIGRKLSFTFFRDKLDLVYNGVNLERFRAEAAKTDLRKDLGIPEHAFVAGASGTYVAGKGFEYLIKAAGALKSRIPGMRMIVVGFQPSGSEAYIKQLKESAQKAGLGDTIIFMGRYGDMPAFFRAIDVLVFPSLIDPFGRVLIEAMACSRAVVSFAMGGAPEIVEDGVTGWLVKPRDTKALVEKIAFFFLDKQAKDKFGRNGYERCRQLFDIRMNARQIQKIYGELLHDGSLGFVRCPICGVSDHRVINVCAVTEQDAAIEEKYLFLCRCRKCGLVFVNPQPVILEEDPAHLYDRDYFRDYMKFHSIADNGTLQLNESYSWRLSLIRRFKGSGVLLDVGCASGEFLKSSRDAGFSVKGVDISPYACKTARDKYGLDVREGSFENVKFDEHSFDVISFADVLEHIRDPLVFLREINRILKDDGVIYISVPDFGSFHYQFMSILARFTHKNYFVLPHHLYHFSGRTLEKLLKKAGFVILERISSESQIRVAGLRRLVMHVIFFLGRIFRVKDRLVVVAGKLRGDTKDR